jgi:hypothetical protein
MYNLSSVDVAVQPAKVDANPPVLERLICKSTLLDVLVGVICFVPSANDNAENKIKKTASPIDLLTFDKAELT